MLKDPLITSDPWKYHMRKGAFEKAWKFSDRILQSGINREYETIPRHFQNIWNGEPLDGKRVLIRCYHGLGDTIQFIRFAPLVKKIAAEVIVWAQPDLIKLLKSAEGIDRIIPLHNGIPEVDFDTDVEVMELPHVFRTTLLTIPGKIPYLYVKPLFFPKEKRVIHVGLNWKSGNWDMSRDVPFNLFKSFFKIEGIHFYILQANAVASGWKQGFGDHPGEFLLYDYARFIRSLDLVVTVDSMPAHLAGALHVPVWIMLKKQADWRWMDERTDCPWYPSAKLFRQEKQDDWKSVMEKIGAELIALARSYQRL